MKEAKEVHALMHCVLTIESASFRHLQLEPRFAINRCRACIRVPDHVSGAKYNLYIFGSRFPCICSLYSRFEI